MPTVTCSANILALLRQFHSHCTANIICMTWKLPTQVWHLWTVLVSPTFFTSPFSCKEHWYIAEKLYCSWHHLFLVSTVRKALLFLMFLPWNIPCKSSKILLVLPVKVAWVDLFKLPAFFFKTNFQNLNLELKKGCRWSWPIQRSWEVQQQVHMPQTESGGCREGCRHK